MAQEVAVPSTSQQNAGRACVGVDSLSCVGQVFSVGAKPVPHRGSIPPAQRIPCAHPLPTLAHVLYFEAGDEIVDLTCESLEPVVVDLTHNDSVVVSVYTGPLAGFVVWVSGQHWHLKTWVSGYRSGSLCLCHGSPDMS